MVRFILGILLLAVSSFAAPKTIVMVDHSGSMRRHYAHEKVEPLVRAALEAAGGGKADLAKFGEGRPELIPDFGPLKDTNYCNWTHLDSTIPFALARGYDVVWIITDNWYDAEEVKHQDLFYGQLARDEVLAATIFPVTFAPGEGLFGLVAYVLALSREALPSYDKQRDGFLTRVATKVGTKAFSVKPLDHNAIHPYYPDGPPKFPVFQPGQEVKGEAAIAFKSNLEHIDIRRASIVCDVDEVRLVTDDPVLVFGAASYEVTPVIVESLGPGTIHTGYRLTGYRLSFDLGKLELRKSFGAFIRAAFDVGVRTIPLRARIRFRLEEDAVAFTDRFQADYCAPTIADARATGRVYELGKLPGALVRNEIAIDTSFVVPIRARVGIGPFLVLILFLFVLGISSWLLLRYFTRTRLRKWAVQAKTPEDEQPTQCDVSYTGDVGTVRQGRDTYGRIEGSGKAFKVSPDWQPDDDGPGWGMKLEEGAVIRMTRRGSGSRVELTFITPGRELGSGKPGKVEEKKPERRPLPKKR